MRALPRPLACVLLALAPALLVVGAGAGTLACAGAPPHDATPPMAGSAPILPSPAKAERVPSDSAVPVASVPSITR
jgi:hypothetical protein